MKNAIEQVQVISVEKKEFTDKNGEIITYFQIQGMSHESGVFVFNDYSKEEPKKDAIYNMFLEHDSKLKAKVVFKRVE